MDNPILTGRVALITGAARRVGAQIARRLHGAGMNVVLHYRSSADAVHHLAEELNAARAGSAVTVAGDLLRFSDYGRIVGSAVAAWQRLDVLVNNASSFHPTPVGSITEELWNDLVGSNLKAPLFLCQEAAPRLNDAGGCIVNITDIHAERPMEGYPVYCVAKAGLLMLTRSLARELGPRVRVNAVAPGAILWPEDPAFPQDREQVVATTALKRQGEPDDIAGAVLYLVRDAGYVTGQVLNVDGGRSVYL